MNHRVSELLKTPKSIQSEDLNLLKEEINSFPYIQNIRALHLYGVHLYDQESYQKELSTTAAYTTDKKILYQLINGKIQQKTRPEVLENKNVTDVENGSRYFPKNKNFPIKREELPEKRQVKEDEVACLLPNPLAETKPIYVNGERNRILFEGEENFLEGNDHETIDLESTLESGSIVTQKQKSAISEDLAQGTETIREEIVLKENEEVNEVEEQVETPVNETEVLIPSESTVVETSIDGLEVSQDEGEESNEAELSEFTPEEIINEDKITSTVEKGEVSSHSELSFHGTESFMPEVKIESGNNDELSVSDISQPIVNKHEDEMRRLIEEVEKKMKANKIVAEEEKENEPETISHDINFAETQGFHAVKGDKHDIIQDAPIIIENSKEEKEEETESKAEIISKVDQEIKSGWKPMSLESNVPDSLINKPTQISQPKIETTKEELLKEEDKLLPIEIVPQLEEDESVELNKEEPEMSHTDIVEEKKEEAPVMNVSFFSSDISSWTTANKKEEQKDNDEEDVMPKEELVEEEYLDPIDSNVPGFINTWQSWLKIDRTEKEPVKVKAEVKSKVIESFIENNPKISQLKDESSFVVKEKNDDISHLMTETLAKLYFEQKLYTKAIKAFEILAGKHPERKSYFEDKIQEVKDVRGKN